MAKPKIPTTPKQIDKLIEAVYYELRTPISVMKITELFRLGRKTYISAMDEKPLTIETLEAAKAAVKTALAQFLATEAAL